MTASSEPGRPSGDTTRSATATQLTVVGWREWIALPKLGVPALKAKVDTGALTSALHVFALEEYESDGRTMARFEIHPKQRSTRDGVIVETEITDHRTVRSSSGASQKRPVIITDLTLGDARWPIEITLTSRDQMGFRMLLGRRALRRNFLVDPARSFVVSRRPERQA